ncbi:MAG: HD domain-containing protein [Bryobacteraceae bacterium]
MFSQRFEDALAYTARLHAGQTRKGSGIPYIAHLLAVSALAIEFGADEDEAIGALLHDAVEDQGGPPTLTEIRRRYGVRVADIVSGCTDADTTPKPPWRHRKEVYIEHKRTADSSVALVCACDKLHNARSIVGDYRQVGEDLWDRFTGGREGTLWYYRELVGALRQAGAVPQLLEELDRTVTDLERMTAVQSR